MKHKESYLFTSLKCVVSSNSNELIELVDLVLTTDKGDEVIAYDMIKSHGDEIIMRWNMHLALAVS